jgi:chromosome segregation ATPase
MSQQNQLRSLRTSNQQLRERIRQLEKDLDEVRFDRQQFREHFAERYTWFWQLLERGEQPSMTWLCKNDAAFVRRVKWWAM